MKELLNSRFQVRISVLDHNGHVDLKESTPSGFGPGKPFNTEEDFSFEDRRDSLHFAGIPSKERLLL